MTEKLSVVIGRFQTHKLHQGHLELLQEANRLSDNVLVLIGCTSAVGTDKNPLDFKTRASLFYSTGILSNPIIKPLNDLLSDKDWSDQIDSIIENLGFEKAIIWGGRDNSIEGYYSGKHEVRTIEQKGIHSATALRKEVAKQPLECAEFRAGIIYHAENRYPIVYSTVDVIVNNDDKYLVGKKGDKFCFIGGFVDPTDANLEDAATRELQEETGITSFGDIDYCGSIKIEDERYRGTKDCIMTHCFMVRNARDFGNEIQDKEFKEFVWATKEELKELLHDFHKALLTFIN